MAGIAAAPLCSAPPACVRAFPSDLGPLLLSQSSGTRLPTPKTALAAERHGRGVFAFVGLGQHGGTGSNGRNELGELIGAAGPLLERLGMMKMRRVSSAFVTLEHGDEITSRAAA